MKSIFIEVSLFILLLTVSSCSLISRYTSEGSVKKGDVVDVHGKITNLARFEQFIVNFKNQQKDFVRLTSYTIEGDPVFQELEIKGKLIDYSYDDTEDRFAAGGGGKQTQCLGIGKEVGEKNIKYYLGKCLVTQKKIYILSVPKTSF